MQSLESGSHSTRSAFIALGLLSVVLPAVVAAFYVLPSPVALVGPGPVQPVEPLIKVEGASYEPGGHLYLTALRVSLQPRLGQYILAPLQPDVSTLPKSEALPVGMPGEEFQKLSQRLLQESQTIAQVVALRQAGYSIRSSNADVSVVSLLPGSPAASQLQPGDIIESADGEDIHTVAELASITQGHLQGEPMALGIRRSGHRQTVTLPALPGPVDTEAPVLGIVAVTVGFEHHFPIDIKLEPGPLSGGPSGGLMYALGIYNALITEDITRGHKIAGTGTLRLNGKVGPVCGVPTKVRAAEAAGVEYFLVPLADSAAARATAQNMKIIPVQSFQEAVTALEQIDAGSSRGPVVPARSDTILACMP